MIVSKLRPQVTNSPDEPRLFRLQEKPEDPHAGIKMAQGLVSLVYICGVSFQHFFFDQIMLFYSLGAPKILDIYNDFAKW